MTERCTVVRGRRAARLLSFYGAVVLVLSASVAAQAPQSGIVRQVSDVQFPQGDHNDCLQFFVENGNLKTGPSTAIMKATPGCVVRRHYHTAEEQLIIVKGNVSTGMEGMQETVLGPGGFAMMPSKRIHWFTCTAKEECLMFVTFDRPYDIVWVDAKESKSEPSVLGYTARASALEHSFAGYRDDSRIRTTSESVWPRSRQRFLPSGDQWKLRICSESKAVICRPREPSRGCTQRLSTPFSRMG